MVANDTYHSGKKIVAAIGKWEILHYGHKNFLIRFANDENVEKLIVIIGSCYELGTTKYCIPASEREKMIRAIFKREGIPDEKFEIANLADRHNFEEWSLSLKKLCNSKGVTHFCTGNKEDILEVLEERGETLGFEMIDPEADSDFKYHATDIRKMIIEGDYEALKTLIPDEVMPILFKNSFKELIAASKNQGIKFVPGRQTVDMILLVRNNSDGKIYVLLGNRSMEKVDFPGYLALPGGGIDEFETPYNAVIREFYEETGLEIQVLDNTMEPAIIRFKNVDGGGLEQLFIVGIYGSEDESVAGTQGGSSQCFGIFVEDDLDKYNAYLNPKSDLTNLRFYEINEAMEIGLAFQHSTMIKKALDMFNAYPDLKKHPKYMMF